MKKVLGILMVTMMLVVSLAGCATGASDSNDAVTDDAANTEATESSSNDAGDDTEVDVEDLPVLKVAIAPYLLSIPVVYMQEMGWPEENGFIVETTVFQDGNAINEAIAANLVDIATTGPPAVFAMARYDAKLIAEQDSSAGGVEVYVRPDSEIAQVKGYLADYPELYGSPETIKGKSILCNKGTIVHYGLLKWLERMGLEESDVEIVNMSIPQSYQSFLAGQCDIVALNAPTNARAKENGWIQVSSLIDTKFDMTDFLITTNDAYNDEVKKEMIIKFTALLFKANEVFRNDPAFEEQKLKEWYTVNGVEVTDEAIASEVALRPFYTLDEVMAANLGDVLIEQAKFQVSLEKLEADLLPTIEGNIAGDILEEVNKLN